MKKKNLILLFIYLKLNCIAQEPLVNYGINLEKFSYPFPVKTMGVTIQQETLQMAYMDVKPVKANGRTVLLLHGKNFNSAYWETTAHALADSGYRVIMPDQIGFGKSSKPLQMQYSFHLLSQNTKRLLDTLGINKVDVIGHSMGGMLAVRFALFYPGLVEKVILECPLGLKDFEKNISYKSVDEYYVQELAQNYTKLREYQLENYYHGNWKEEYDKWVRILAGRISDPDYPLVALNSARAYDMINTQPVVYELKNIKVPMLLILGQLDKIGTGKDLIAEEPRKTMAHDIRTGKKDEAGNRVFKLAQLNGVGHVPHLEAFDQFIKEVLKFL